MSTPGGSGGYLNREEADAALTGLGAACDRLAAAMFALDSHPGLAVLRDAALTGATRAVAEHVDARTDLLWVHFTVLREHLDRARTIRAERSRPGQEELAQLTRLLRDPVVELGDDGVPLDPGAGSAPAVWLSLTELAQRVDAECSALSQQVSDVHAAVAACTARVASLTETLDRVRSLAAELGEQQPRRQADETDEISQRMLTDPVMATGSGGNAATLDARLRRLSADLDAEVARLRGVARTRDEYPDRIAALRTGIDAVAEVETKAAQLYAVVNVKIANPGLPPAPSAAAALHERLGAMQALATGRRWRQLADELATLEPAIGRAREVAAALREAADGLLRRRAELRGRLDAYRVKAAASGLAEQQDLATLHRTAHDLLYTSPCDLPAATRAVVAYQQALADLTGVPGRPTPEQPREPSR